MGLDPLKFRDWVFLVDKDLTKSTYERVSGSGADTCICNDCKNYVVYCDNVFPEEIINLFEDLGIDYRKEVEISHLEKQPNGLHHITGWFHFKGEILKGKDCSIPSGEYAFSIDLTQIADNFLIGFTEGNDLTYFDEKNGLVQIEFETSIPWVIDTNLESE